MQLSCCLNRQIQHFWGEYHWIQLDFSSMQGRHDTYMAYVKYFYNKDHDDIILAYSFMETTSVWQIKLLIKFYINQRDAGFKCAKSDQDKCNRDLFKCDYISLFITKCDFTIECFSHTKRILEFINMKNWLHVSMLFFFQSLLL